MTNSSSGNHSIEQTMVRLASLREEGRKWLFTDTDAQPGWISIADLATERSHLDELFKRIGSHYKALSLRPSAALWFGHYAFAVEAVAVACFLIEKRVPDLSVENVQVRFEEDGDIANIAWMGRSFAGLADDPDASHPECIVLPTLEDLRDHLRTQLQVSFTPIVNALSAYSSMGKPGLWALAADYCSYAFTWLGELMGDEMIGVEESRLFAATPSKVSVKRDFIPIEHLGKTFYFLERTSCCQYFKVEGGGYCSTCPHRPLEERIALEKQYMEEDAAKAK